MGAETIFFFLFGGGAILSTLGVLLSRNPINSAISLVVSFFFLAGIYAMLSAHLNAIMQIMVYAGAIMVLFVFVLMLLNFGDEEHEKPRLNPTQIISLLVGAALLIAMFSAATAFVDGSRQVFHPSMPPGFGGVEAIGHALLTSYVLPFEMAAVLLLVGIVGAVVVAKRRF
ncbi:MAG: NADH-quinone oxidoreductase subunit J [Deltaproteobacteria bacterium]|nr:MAG: NADH-quinone oxidoreductase subunit J [Deltaproteobacteria bacterium]